MRHILPVALAAVLLSPVSLRAQQPEFVALASKLADQARKLSSKKNPKKLLVLDFPICKGTYTELGKVWADELSRALDETRKVQTIDRNRIRQFLAEEDLDWASLSDKSVQGWIGDALGAHGVLTACVKPGKDQSALEVALLDVFKRKQMKQNARIPSTPNHAELMGRKLETPPPLGAQPGTAQLSADERVYQIGRGGVGYAMCASCPTPQYTQEARDAKVQGSVLLAAIITADGRAARIRVVKGLPMGMTQKAVEAVRKWRFRPALGPNGQPVAVWQQIEINFHIF